MFTVSEKRTPVVGDSVFVWPRHICPTIAHYDPVAVCGTNNEITEWWKTDARGRSIHAVT